MVKPLDFVLKYGIIRIAKISCRYSVLHPTVENTFWQLKMADI